MSLPGLLIHRLEIYRRTGTTDRFGQPSSINPRQHVVGGETLVATVPCRAWSPSGGLKMEERMTDTFERSFTVYVELGVEIREDDALRAIDADGRVIFGLSKVKDSDIKYDSLGAHHAELTIWEQAGPGVVI